LSSEEGVPAVIIPRSHAEMRQPLRANGLADTTIRPVGWPHCAGSRFLSPPAASYYTSAAWPAWTWSWPAWTWWG